MRTTLRASLGFAILASSALAFATPPPPAAGQRSFHGVDAVLAVANHEIGPTLSDRFRLPAVPAESDLETAIIDRLRQGMMQQLLTGAIRLPIPDPAPHENVEP